MGAMPADTIAPTRHHVIRLGNIYEAYYKYQIRDRKLSMERCFLYFGFVEGRFASQNHSQYCGIESYINQTRFY